MQSVSQVEDPYVIMGRDVFKDEQLDEKSGSESPLPPVQDSSVRSGKWKTHYGMCIYSITKALFVVSRTYFDGQDSVME